jgi:hypothetical protein
MIVNSGRCSSPESAEAVTVFPEPGGPEKEKFAPRAQAVFAQPLPLPLFEKHALQPLGQSLGQSHVAEADRGRLDGEQICEFAARLEVLPILLNRFARKDSALGSLLPAPEIVESARVGAPGMRGRNAVDDERAQTDPAPDRGVI